MRTCRSVEDVAAVLLRAPFRQELLRDLGPPGRAGGGSAGGATAAPGAAAGSSGGADGSSGAASGYQGVMQAVGASVDLEDACDVAVGMPHVAVADVLEKWRVSQRQARATAGPAMSPAAGPGAGGTKRGGGNATATPSSGHSSASAAAHQAGTLLGMGARLAPASDGAVALLSGVNARGLHTASHIHTVLGRAPRLAAYYLEQRRLQVAADLVPPHAPFLESYQAYLAQVGRERVDGAPG